MSKPRRSDKQQLNVEISAEMKSALQKAARHLGETITDFTVRAIENELNRKRETQSLAEANSMEQTEMDLGGTVREPMNVTVNVSLGK